VSPRRRLLLLAALGLVVLVVSLGVALIRRGEPALAPPPGGVAQGRPGPVLLVPGYGGGTGGLQTLAARLRAAGHRAAVVALPGDGTGDLRVDARVLDKRVRALLAAGAPSVDVVGYSAGGVVARLWAGEDGGAAVTRRVVTLGSPHHGADLAAGAAATVPDRCPLACQQLVPGNPLLAQLNQGDETPPGPVWVSLWSAVDQTVTPPASARLAGALNVRLQDVCPGARVAHGALPVDPLSVGLVLRALGRTSPTVPVRADCAVLRAAGAAGR